MTVVKFSSRRKVLGFLAGTLAATALPVQSVPAQGNDSRVALVIGNSAYKSAPLKNPVNDANAVADKLRQLGFTVIQRENTSLRDLIEALREFSLRAVQSSVRLVFYAGHGIQAKGRNYLVPVDIDLQSEDEIPTKSADIGELIDRLSGIKHGINIVILDACRVNPFSAGVIVGPDGRRIRFRGVSKSGLAPLDAPMGTLVAFSTAPNGIALDSPAAKNSLYVKHLLTHLSTPGMPIELLFKKVRIGVAEETQRVQVPWESSSLTADFCFKADPTGSCSALR
ncbi:MAG TPA: caspase family protein [Burkholderiaceae bacterium]|nr:caspase family protein [Burkholderiaceae bacterium]